MCLNKRKDELCHMKKYVVTIIETLEKEVEVEAQNAQEAKMIVEKGYYNSDNILDADNYTGVKFRVESPNQNRDNSR